MRYKLIGLALILLLSTPAYGQRISPVIAETPRTAKPTTVITGQPFTQTYVVKFFDSNDEFEEIKIQEDQLNQSTLGSFEVLNLDIEKKTKQADYTENVWHLKYTLRIINEKKSIDLAAEKKEPYKIPPIIIPWTGKKIGSMDSNTVINNDVKTDEVYINYVTTITQDPYIFIRDDIDFGDFSSRALWFLVGSLFLGIVPLALWVWMFVRKRRIRARLPKEKVFEQESEQGINPDYFQRVSRKKAVRNLRKAVKRLMNFGTGKKAYNATQVMSELQVSIMSLLKAEVLGSDIGTTPKEMAGLVNNMPSSPSKQVLAELADLAAVYQNYLETGSVQPHWHNEPISEAERIRSMLGKLKWYYWLTFIFRKIFRR
ncbi:MAG: hypothetical protein A3B91_04150 [Candidatus Yanofskybacteria bacterium RIFCSPHIGHO2_02_FULL_41_29]|uniref:DUF4381 domain-containing protein n=1 Tax=Candidatus Yanofskybacteria bacterium RIFCSPHIGHO2_01_FULL_41_53 TaxID=1802663 RepID=A0A1F8EF46_9BACT|nr:MAG: hypothetical protein A2650_02865 [Candidatus Yanofskybacteria bacterium RIFCSPHIGHO2_01_FULL_41_53]OGN10493.1 MAG: hypothetical protein A3B91_04150 [Candidatus Yanofskybacteria bacterium RIFCSPHIGHO2_02_FULL_41_29]OGN18794.1 MAG: hypothetical protein A3F48_02370 [Candidatus Yanofskybacteria bacterium RIFCSPHIGHO2_12_FULL_41_9]OGN21540.1 MAG: hypothetical protein A2916_04630 [Candidatus Yanofskybacteria bacterium RIFCSPLOWO2_01_FULL_41_67]OGN29680.1 MAG: hypothetical protein A3H54_02850 